jgi:ribose transport system substrate-binding protein
MKLYFAIYEAGKPRNARRSRILGAVSAVLLTTASYAASVAVDVGNMKVMTDPEQPLKIALFLPALVTPYLQANLKGAQDEAAKVGATVNVFDGKADPMNQLNQMENAIQTKQYNAFLALPLAGPVVCKAATEDAPKAGILVSTYHFSVCDTTFAADEKQWAPGTLQFVGGATSYPVTKAYLEYIMKTNPGPQKVGVITGLDLAADTLRMKKALEELRQQYPQFQVVDVQSTDYTIPDAQKHAQNMLQTHPDIGIIVTNWYTITRGSLSAIDQAGKSGKIKLYDFGGTAWSKKAIEAGQVVATVPIYGYTATAIAVRNLALAHQGKEVPRYIPNDGAPADAPSIVDKSNIDKFTPESD